MNKKTLIAGLLVTVMLLIPINSAYSNIGMQIDNKPIITSNMGNILYVGGGGSGNYTTIQEAIDDAVDGDTVFVYDDSSPYYENIEIDKYISLIGEDKDSTIIDGRGYRHVVNVKEYADGVTISGFTIQKGGESPYTGILIENTKHINISKNNIISNRFCGIRFSESEDCIVSRNNVSFNNRYGIYLIHSNNITITDNTLSYQNDSLSFSISDNNFIFNNTISEGENSMNIQHCSCNKIKENVIYNGGSIFIYNSTYHEIINNYINIISISPGIKLLRSNKNKITGNSLFNTGLIVSESYFNNVSDNTVNNKSLVYLEGKSNEYIDNDSIGQIIIVRCNNITIKNLNLSNSYICIQFSESNDCSISNNILIDSYEGIQLEQSNNSNFFSNYISNNLHGVILHYSKYNTFFKNNIVDNKYHGIGISSKSNKNMFYLNNIINNTENVYDYSDNIWDNGKYGNYWGDYKERYPYARPKLLKPWMWNTPYEISSWPLEQDNCPLVNQWPKSKSKDIPNNNAISSSPFLRFLERYPLLNLVK